MSLTSPVNARFDISTDSPGFSRKDLVGFAFHSKRARACLAGTSRSTAINGLNQYSALLDPHEEYDLIVDRSAATL